MGANMRRLALLCSAFAFLCAVGATDAQMQAAPAKHSASKSIADYNEAVKLEPKNALAFNNRGTAYSERGESDAAIADFSAAIKHNARFASAYFNRANAYAAKGEVDRAIADYTAAIKHNRRNV